MLTRLPWFLPLTLSLHNLSSRLWRTMLTILGIVLGVAVVLAIDITNQSTLSSIKQTLERAVGKAELIIIPIDDADTLDEQLIDWIQALPGVQLAAPDVVVNTFLVGESPGSVARWSGRGVQVGRTFEIHGIDPQVDPQVRLYYLESGRMPVTERYEVVTSLHHASERDLTLGDDLVLLTPNGEQRLEIVGLLSDEGVAALNGGEVGFTSSSVVQDMFALGSQLHEISIQVAPELAANPARLAGVKDSLAHRLEDQAQVIYSSARGNVVPRMLNTYQIGLTFFSVISVFVGAFLIYNTFSMSVAERTKEIGMFRAIGMSRSQILLIVMLEAAILGVIGALLGVFAGVWLARGLLVLLGGFFSEASQLIAVSRQSMLSSTAIGIGVTLCSALIPASLAANISPLEALRVRSRAAAPIPVSLGLGGLILLVTGYSGIYVLKWREQVLVPAGSTAIFMLMLGAVFILPLLIPALERISRWLTFVIYGDEGTLGSSNVQRSTFRTTLTIASLMISLVMIIGIGTVSFTFEADIQRWINSALGGDIFVIAPDTLQSSFNNQLQTIPGIDAISPSRYIQVRLAPSSLELSSSHREELIFSAIEPEAFRRIGDMVFTTGKTNPELNWSALSEDRALFVSTVVADEFGVSAGDSLNLQTRRGEQSFRIAAVITDFSSQGYVVVGTYSNLKRWFNETGVDRFTIKVQPGVDPYLIVHEIETRFKDRHNLDVQTAETLKSSVESMLDQAFQLFDVLSLVGVIIGTLGVFNTITMNVLERIREIGALRSIGMTRIQVLRMILAEALSMGAMGCAFGLLFGYLISLAFVRALVVLSSYDVTYLFAPRPYFLSVLIALGVSQFAALAPAWRASRVNIIAAIKHE